MSARGEAEERDRARRRRRRTPEAAQREIVEAAQALLRERPYREVTVDEVMRRTGLSRPSFYVYFHDRHELLRRVVESLQVDLLTVSNRWFAGDGDGAAQLREAVSGVVAVYAQHGPVMRALADAAVDDETAEAAYGALIQTVIDATARHIEEEIAAGRIKGLDAVETAKALTWMMERYLNQSLGRRPAAPPEAIADALGTICVRVLYGEG